MFRDFLRSPKTSSFLDPLQYVFSGKMMETDASRAARRVLRVEFILRFCTRSVRNPQDFCIYHQECQISTFADRTSKRTFLAMPIRFFSTNISGQYSSFSYVEMYNTVASQVQNDPNTAFVDLCHFDFRLAFQFYVHFFEQNRSRFPTEMRFLFKDSPIESFSTMFTTQGSFFGT